MRRRQLLDHAHDMASGQPLALGSLLRLDEQNGADVVILDIAHKFRGGDRPATRVGTRADDVAM